MAVHYLGGLQALCRAKEEVSGVCPVYASGVRTEFTAITLVDKKHISIDCFSGSCK
jgi:hypothetical protein